MSENDATFSTQDVPAFDSHTTRSHTLVPRTYIRLLLALVSRVTLVEKEKECKMEPNPKSIQIPQVDKRVPIPLVAHVKWFTIESERTVIFPKVGLR